MKTLRNIYFAIFDSHLNYSCIVWAQNINTVRRLIILQKRALRIMNFKDQLFHSCPLFSSNNIVKLCDKITLENILFVSKSVNRQVPSIFYILHILVYIFQETYIGTKLAGLKLTILIFQLFEPKNMVTLV